MLILDELSQVDPQEAGKIAYMLANGSGKVRAAKTGAALKCREWRLLFLSAGEISLSEHMQKGGKNIKAGQKVRLVDIPADAGLGYGIFDNLHNCCSGNELSRALNTASQQYYGTAAIAFLKKITDPNTHNALSNRIKELSHEFIATCVPLNTSGQVQRVAEKFALIAAAGEIATDYGITGWPQGEAIKAAAGCFKAWLAYRGGIGNHEEMDILRHIQTYFEAHGSTHFEEIVSEGAEARVCHNRVGFRKHRQETTEYFVLPHRFCEELCAGYDQKLVIETLLKHGLLRPSSEGKAQSAHRLPTFGLKKCYHIVSAEPVKNERLALVTNQRIVG